MIEKVFLNCNDPKIRDQLSFLGYKQCECTLHPSSKWLSFEVRDDMIIAHGAGLPCKGYKDCDVARIPNCLLCVIYSELEKGGVRIFASVKDVDDYFKNNFKQLSLKALRRRMWQCGLCGRKFYEQVPHKCNTGFRKRNFKWINLVDKI